MEEIQRSFGAVDYVVFGGLFLVSAAIGAYFAYKSRKQEASSDDYLRAGRKMHAIPVAFSLTASYLSAITVIGVPSEFYIYGTMFTWYVIADALTAVPVAEIYIPLFYRSGINSSYEYLEMRFNKAVRIMAATIFTIQEFLYLGIVIYAPSLALNAVTGLDTWTSVIVTCVVCTFYTALGGLKAVIWTDVFQCTVMVIGFVAVIIQGCRKMGGMSNVWDIAEQRGRIDFVHFEFDPRYRLTFWLLVCGGTFDSVSNDGTSYIFVQRYLSCRTEKHAKVAVYLTAVGKIIISLLAGLSGLVMFAYYADCDPFSAGWVSATDQLMPYFVMDILYSTPGLPGVYLCSAFSGTLSSVSSGINGMAAVVLEDFIKPHKKLSQNMSVLVSKILVMFFGACCLGMSAVASNLGGVLESALSLSGTATGPMLALFTMGWAFPWCNSWGALSGTLSGFGVGTWCYIGSTIYPPPAHFSRELPLSTEQCVFPNSTSTMMPSTMTTDFVQSTTSSNPYRPPIAELYAVSYLMYSIIGFSVALVVGHIVSFLTGYQQPSKLPRGVTIPFFDHVIFKWIPAKTRRFLWCGVLYDKYERGTQLEDEQKKGQFGLGMSPNMKNNLGYEVKKDDDASSSKNAESSTTAL